MKTIAFLFVALFSFSLVSCNLNGRNEASPSIVLSQAPILKNSTDTLKLSFDPENSAYLLDTISVGDTVSFKLVVWGGYHGIEEMSITLTDTTQAQLFFEPKDSLDRIFLPTSKYEEGLFLANGDFIQLYFPFKMYAKDSTKEVFLKMAVLTSASANYSTRSVRIKTPIKEKTE